MNSNQLNQAMSSSGKHALVPNHAGESHRANLNRGTADLCVNGNVTTKSFTIFRSQEVKFMIFDCGVGQNEGHERDKLLYHWTKDSGNNGKIDINEQIDDICLCDASIGASTRLSLGLNISHSGEHAQFTGNQNSNLHDPSFASETGRHLVLTFESTVIIMIEAEPSSSIWIAIHVSLAQPMDSNEYTPQTISSPSLDPESIPAGAIRQTMINIYSRFCLINGSFQMLKQRMDDMQSVENFSAIREAIRVVCDNYFNTVLPEIHLNSVLSNVVSLYNHIAYLDLNPLTLMTVTSFMNHLVCVDPRQIRHTIAIFNDQLLWSSLNMVDSRQLYNYMVGVLIRDALQEELIRETEKVRKIKENMPIYLSESHCMLDKDISNLTIGKEQSKQLSKFYLTVFRSSNNMTLGLIFQDTDQFELIQKCERILTSDTRLGVVPLASLAKSVGQSFLKATQYNSSASQLSQQSVTASSTSTTRKKNSSSNPGLLKNVITSDQKYICLDRLNLSVTSTFSMDASTRDIHFSIDSANNEISSSSRRMRLVKYMIDLEPEMQDIHKIIGRRVDEYLVKTISDTWLAVMNSKYRCIYSVYKTRNAGLNEAQQAANNLKLALASRFLLP